MQQLYEAGNDHLRPNVVAYNAVVNACAYTTDNEIHESSRIVEIAHMTLKAMEQSDYVNPDQVTYGTFLKVCANHMSDCSTRQQVVEVLFKKCALVGQVGNYVIQQLRIVADEELYYRLVGRSIYEDITLDDLPKDWTCNVVEGKMRRKRNLSPFS